MAMNHTWVQLFLQSCSDGSVEYVRYCLSLGVNVNCVRWDGARGLILSAAGSRLPVLDLLLQQPGIDVNAVEFWWRGTALSAACRGNNVEIVRRLLSRHDIDVNLGNIDGVTALHQAAARGHSACLELLLAHPRLDLNKKTRRVYTTHIPSDERGVTAIVMAVKHNQKAAVELLMQDVRTDLGTKNENELNLVQIAL